MNFINIFFLLYLGFLMDLPINLLLQIDLYYKLKFNMGNAVTKIYV